VCTADDTSPAAISTSSAPVDRVAEHCGHSDAENGAGAQGCWAGGLLEHGDQEHRRLQPLAQHGEEGHADQCDGRAVRQRIGGVGLDHRLHARAVAPAPDDHPGDGSRRHQRDDRLQTLLLALRERLVGELQTEADRQADPHGRQYPDPHRTECVATARAHQERRDDAHDQRRLEPLAEPDHERRYHDLPPRVPAPSLSAAAEASGPRRRAATTWSDVAVTLSANAGTSGSTVLVSPRPPPHAA
jgi:hypothetical protein